MSFKTYKAHQVSCGITNIFNKDTGDTDNKKHLCNVHMRIGYQIYVDIIPHYQKVLECLRECFENADKSCPFIFSAYTPPDVGCRSRFYLSGGDAYSAQLETEAEFN